MQRMFGQIKMQFFAMFVESDYKPRGALERTLDLIDLFLDAVAQSERLMLIKSKQDLVSLSASNKRGALLAVEGAEAISAPSILRTLYRLGVRSVGLTWNQRNQLADGVLGGDGGLTPDGVEVVQEMNRLGMLVDTAHMAPKSFWHVLRLSQQPIIVSHANCKAIHDHPRNLSDLQLKALASAGGVACITFAPQFLSGNTATIDDVVEHIAYAAQLMGSEYVGIGSDFDGVDTLPQGINGVEDYAKLRRSLSTKGFNSDEVNAISGLNVRRLLMQVLP